MTLARRHYTILAVSTIVSIYSSIQPIYGFVSPNSFGLHQKPSRDLWSVVVEERTTGTAATDRFLNEQHDEALESLNGVRAPLKFIGPYPCLSLRFPRLATASQMERNQTGVSMDFVLDTAANVNTINQQVAEELKLPVVGSALPGVGSAGVITGGNTYMLGDAQLDGLPKRHDDSVDDVENENDEKGPDEVTTNLDLFMTNLTASAIPIASPAAAGLLSMAFFYAFDGGVEFEWGSQVMTDGLVTDSSGVRFYENGDFFQNEVLKDMIRVPIDPVDITKLPSVMVEINGVKIPALLDTGSPITVLNSKAAQEAGIDFFQDDQQSEKQNKNSLNPFSSIVNRFQQAQATAQAAQRGDILTIAGTNGGTVTLRKSIDKASLSVVGSDEMVSFGEGNVYVGDIPGLAALNGLGVQSPPALVLGMDVLKLRPRMLLRARDSEVYF